MSQIINTLCVVLVITGSLFTLISVIGVLKFPDFYTRSHAASLVDTFGTIFVLSGLLLYNGFNIVSLKLSFVLVFILLANPIGTHALGFAALIQELKPLLRDSNSKKGAGKP